MNVTAELGLKADHSPVPGSVQGWHPPVVIMNLFYSGLGIARDLADKGIRVVGLSAERRLYGNFTRFCEVRSAPNSQVHPEQMVELLLGLSRELDGAVIFPTRDADVVLLDHYRGVLGPHYRLAIPSSQCLTQVLDKSALARIASDSGVPTPRTLRIHSRADLQRVADEIGFPCVIKPVSSVDWRLGNSWNLVRGRKAFRVDSSIELDREYLQISAANAAVLAQEWIPGDTDQIVVMAGYLNSRSEPQAYFTGRKLVQSPDDFGTGCIVASEPIPRLHEITLNLWNALHYTGMAEVEYKYDWRTSEYRLIEINTRHWDQHRLARASGINLTWIAYRDLIGDPLPLQAQPTATATWIAEDALVLYFLRGIWHHQLQIGALLRKLRGPRLYGIASWRDPMPIISRAASMTSELALGIEAKLKRSCSKRKY